MSTGILCLCTIIFGLVILSLFQVILNSVFKLNNSYTNLRSKQQELVSVHKSIEQNKPFVLHCLQILNLNLADQDTCDRFVTKKTGFFKFENVTKIRKELLEQIELTYPNYWFETKFENCCNKYYPHST